ncbi:MAG: type 4a pilus biogenesis protein PilO [Legionella sp.]|nr:type 4a pilus biogenesis protein PilO [Legionella sp.]
MKHFNVSELTLENSYQWPFWVKYLSATLLALLLIGIGYRVFIKSEFELYDVLTTNQQTLKAQFEQKQQLAANLQAYKKQFDIINQRFDTMLKQLTSQNETPGLLEDISRTGKTSGLTFELFAPGPEVHHNFYSELPVTIKVVGNYHQLALFVSRVSEMARLVSLHDFKLSVVSRGQETDELLQMEIIAKIYRYQLI